MKPESAIRHVRVIGIGVGSPAHLTAQAVQAMQEVDVFLVADKGEAAHDLLALRESICEQYLDPGSYRFVRVPDPSRGRDADRDAAAYGRGVRDWHGERVQRYLEVLRDLPEHESVGFLVWGDPALYDSTLRIVEDLASNTPVQVQVVPGISAIQVLAAEHQMVLNQIGEPVHITTGRRLTQEWHPGLGTVVVMLDAHLACRQLLTHAPDLHIYWGAYLGLPHQVLRSGRLADIGPGLVELRAELRDQHGWVMDTYILRPPAATVPTDRDTLI